jgi:hypothetical protein
MCIDYRVLNAVTKKNGYPFLRILSELQEVWRGRTRAASNWN